MEQLKIKNVVAQCSYIISETKKHYQNIDERIMQTVQLSLSDMKISQKNIDKIIILVAIACDKHYTYGLCNAKKNNN